MAHQNIAYFAFNRGLISRLALARYDLKRYALSAETFKNWMPRALGSMMLRPGLGFKGDINANQACRTISFVSTTAPSDKGILEFTPGALRVWVNDALVTRNNVFVPVTNGTFAANLNGWIQNDEAGGVSSWAAGGYMQLLGDGTNRAIRDQQVVIASTAEHALKIVVARGPVTLRVGSALGNDDYVSETDLGTGNHSIAFTPGGNFWIRFMSRLNRIVLLDECDIEAQGPMVVQTPYVSGDMQYLRNEESVDVIYMGCSGKQQMKIERRGVHSWSVVYYQPADGPFRVRNVTTKTMTPSVLTGNGTLTCSVPFFQSGHTGALFAVTSTGQAVTKAIGAQNVFSDPIDVTSVGTDRAFQIAVTGLTGTGTTITLQRSFGAIGSWQDVEQYTTDTAKTLNDGFDNQIVYYRIGCKTGDFVAGAITVGLTTTIGSIRGICRITSFVTPTLCNMEVLTNFGGVTASDNWEEGQWSNRRGWPCAPAIYEGRLFWGGKDAIVGGVSDGYESFDPTVVGDSGPINRTIGEGPVDTVNWLLPMMRLVVGAQTAEHSCRSSSLDEPLTPTNFNIKATSTQGSSNVQAVKVDFDGIYVQRGGSRVFQLNIGQSSYAYSFNYTSVHLSALVPTIGKPGIVRMDVQRQPDTRIHFVRSDGTAAVLVFDGAEQVNCWVEVDTIGAGGKIEDVVVVPGDAGEDEDHVYYVVQRTINGNTVRYLERWAFEADCQGGALNAQADAYVVSSGQIIAGLDHLEGQQVVVWANGADIGTAADGSLIYRVTGGKITLPQGYDPVVVGLPYEARWKSAKLAQIQAQLGTPLNQQKRIGGLGLIMQYTHAKGLQFGPDFTRMDDLPSSEAGAIIADGTIYDQYDEQPFIFPGLWNTDARLCLRAFAPRPCTILSAICDMEMNE